MIKKPVTQEEKKLVGYLTKKKKQSGKSPHVYYNKRKANGKSNYLSGKFYSEKNKRFVTYRSSYELRFFHLLEKRPDVISYEVESIEIPYKDLDGSYRKYIPDALVLLANGDIKICEIKPEAMLDNVIVKRKAQACKYHFKKIFNDSDISCEYLFITEKELFSSPSDYSAFIKQHS